MANPPSRRISSSILSNHHYQLPISDSPTIPFQSQNPTTTTTARIATLLISLKFFLKKPHSFPFLLSIFLLLTWVSLRFQRHTHNGPSSSSSSMATFSMNRQLHGGEINSDANLVRFHSLSSDIAKDKRGWLIDPVSLALQSGISGGARSCSSVHIGEIRPGGIRGNHRHHSCNETFVIWGAKTMFRLENNGVDKGYAEVTIGAGEVGVAASPSGTAHALVNIDPSRTTFFLGCQDSILNYNDSTTDFSVWKDL